MPSAKLISGIFFCVLTKATRLVLVSIADDRSLGCSVCPGVRPPAADSKGFVQVSELHIAKPLCLNCTDRCIQYCHERTPKKYPWECVWHYKGAPCWNVETCPVFKIFQAVRNRKRCFQNTFESSVFKCGLKKPIDFWTLTNSYLSNIQFCIVYATLLNTVLTLFQMNINQESIIIPLHCTVLQ